MLLNIFRLISLIPLRIVHAVGRAAGRLVFALPGRYRDRLIAHAHQAGYSDPAFARRSAAEAGAMILELSHIWFRSQESIGLVVSDEEHIVHQALNEKRGILFLSPHLGCFELLARYATVYQPMTVMFRPPKQAFFMPLLQAARNSTGVKAVPADLKGVRAFLKALKNNEFVGMLPDQVPQLGEGVWAPFFGREAWTMTLPGKLARVTNPIVIVAACERLPKGKGWRMHYLRAPDMLPDSPRDQAMLFNRMMQTIITRFPEQYLWSYHRYKRPLDVPLPPVESHE
jgi:Kdo2-lipid IVA lauroyltransferase/acyltransferase